MVQASNRGRDLLRSATRAQHDRLDALVSGADLASRRGLAAYLHMNIAALHSVQSNLDAAWAEWAGLLEDLEAAARIDCDVLGASPPGHHAPSGRHGTYALGAVYVVAGSRLGARVLRRRALGSADPKVAHAHQFFEPRPIDRAWPTIVRKLGEIDARSSAVLVDDARATFGLFEDAFKRSAEAQSHLTAQL